MPVQRAERKMFNSICGGFMKCFHLHYLIYSSNSLEGQELLSASSRGEDGDSEHLGLQLAGGHASFCFSLLK